MSTISSSSFRSSRSPRRPRFRSLFVIVSSIVALNINYVYGAGLGMGWRIDRGITGIDLSVLLAFANVGVLVWFARLLARESRVTVVYGPVADAAR